MFGTDFIINNVGQGPVAQLVAGSRADPGMLRPYFADDGYPSVTINSGKKKRVDIKNKAGIIIGSKEVPELVEVRIKDLQASGIQVPGVTNATSLRKGEWIEFDNQTIEPQRERLRLVKDIGRVSTYSFNGLANPMLEHETASDPGRAYMDMHALSEGTTDTPLFQLEGQPIPLFHCSYTYDIRRLEASRARGMGLQTRGVNWATRRVLELVERNAIGVAGSPLLYGGGSTQVGGYGRTSGVYGLLNFPDRMTKTDMTIPTGSNPEATISDILEMRDLLYAANHYGPYGIYHSTDWDAFLDNDYARLGGSNANMTLRQRILAIGTEGGESENEKQIRWVKRLDFMTPADSHAFTMVMVSLNQNVIRLLNGMPITIIQYETKGGWELHFKVVCIMLLEMFADFDGNCGILQARTG